MRPNDILPIDLSSTAPAHVGEEYLFRGRVAERDSQLVLIISNDKGAPNMNDSSENNQFNSDDLNFDDFQLEENLSEPAYTPTERDLSFFKNIPVTVTLEVASKEVALGDLMKAGEAVL